MAERIMRAHLTQIGAAAFEAEGGQGGTLIVDGSPDIGGEGRGMRPMELLLSAVASCAAMDVVHILRKQKEPLERLEIAVEGARSDATVAPYTRMHLVFTAHGPVTPQKFERAVGLSVEKYCSVRASLDPAIPVTWEAKLAAPAAEDEAG
jgi:putative redox protein